MPALVIVTTFVTRCPFVAPRADPGDGGHRPDEELAALSLGANGRQIFGA